MDVVHESKRRPYPAPSNVIAVLSRARSRNLPELIDNDFLRLAEVPDVVFGRVKEGLRFLGLTTDADRPTDLLRSIAAAPEEEYRQLLSGAIRDAYKDDFVRVNPSEETQARITDAFRIYEPRSQSARMVMFFLAMCREAGIPVLDAPRARSMRTSNGQARPQRTPKTYRRTVHEVAGPAFPAPRDSHGLLFGVTEDDIASLDEADFTEVWTALGKVARARARARSKAAAPATETAKGGEGDEEGLV
jgi:Family of unknown function (DUF5343)